VTDSPDRDEAVQDDDAQDENAQDETILDEEDEEAAEEADEDEDAAAEDEEEEEDEDAVPARSAAVDELWQELRIDPIQVALPAGKVSRVGYTLRAYRPASQLTPTEAPEPEDDEDDPFAARERARAAEEAALAEELGLEEADDDEPAPEDFEDEESDEDEDEDAEAEADEEEDEDEDVPAFLSHRGKLLLFGTPESLVAFINSDASHDLTQLDTWPTVVKRVGPADIVPTEEDTYELDLVVENLRAGHDKWIPELLISAGEFARDAGWALRLESVITMLSAGSPLDDLDEALRSAATSRVGLFARRKLRRIGVQPASHAWRTVIGKISAAVDWRD
jgi:hypothetical protein